MKSLDYVQGWYQSSLWDDPGSLGVGPSPPVAGVIDPGRVASGSADSTQPDLSEASHSVCSTHRASLAAGPNISGFPGGGRSIMVAVVKEKKAQQHGLCRRRGGAGLVSLALAGMLCGCGGGKAPEVSRDAESATDAPSEKVDEFGLPEIVIWRQDPRKATDRGSAGEREKNAEDDADAGKLRTSVYPAPPIFLMKREKTPTAREVLESYGVVFGPGASAKYKPQTSEVFVRQTAEQLELVDAALDLEGGGTVHLINLRVEIYELPALHALKLQHSAEGEVDHTGEWQAALRLMGEGTARFVTSATILCRSGNRSKFTDMREVIYAADFNWQNPEKPKAILPVFETREVGTIFEVDPLHNEDGETIDLNFVFEYHSAPPTEKMVTLAIPGTTQPVEVSVPVFHAHKITTQLTMKSDSVRLIGAWRPTGKPEFEADDLMQLAFLKADLQSFARASRVKRFP
ncbi:MAG: hypothetical protein ACC661_12525 [Verrucomicrobiales bacterium]